MAKLFRRKSAAAAPKQAISINHYDVILSPHTSLPDGVALAVTAWNKLLTCPGTVTAEQAAAIARGFITAFQCTSNAPEPKSSPGC